MVKSLELENKWKLITKYHDAGFDPLRWLPVCSNEIKLDQLQILSGQLKRNNLRFGPSYYSYFHHPEKKNLEIIRRIYRTNEEIKPEDLKTKKALSIFKWDKKIVCNDDLVLQKIKKVSEQLKAKIELEKVLMIPTNTSEDYQFTLFDHIKIPRGNITGYSIATNSSTQVTDIGQDIDSSIHMEIALTESINLLNLLGCSNNVNLFPIYDAPTEEILDKIRKDIDKFTVKYNYCFEDYSSLKLNGLFFATTATGNSHKEIPNKYDLVDENMQIVCTDKFGLLACFCLCILTTISEKLSEKLYNYGISENRLKELKELAIKNLTEPKISLGKIIAKFLPEFENKFDFNSHIIVTHPISKNGINGLYELSKLINKEVIIDDIPSIDQDVTNFISKEYLVSNNTASTSNTNIIIISKDLSSILLDELSKNKFEPKIIGKIGKSGSSRVIFNNKK